MAKSCLELMTEAGLKPPKVLTLAITALCNLSCRHCWVDADLDSSALQAQAAKVCRIMSEFAALGGRGLTLTGGEPLCHPDWPQIMRCARNLRFDRISLQTNAMLIEADHVATLCELDFPGLSIQVSLDGAEAAAHDLIRGEGAFDRTVGALQRLIRGGLGPRIVLFFTEMRHNLSQIPDLLQLAQDLGISSVVAGSLVPYGRAGEDTTLAPAELKQYQELIDRYESDARFRELYRELGQVAALEWYTARQPGPDCCRFIETPYLTAQGKLYPCVMFHCDEYALFDVFSKSLDAVYTEGVALWRSLVQIKRSRSSRIPKCQSCPDAPLCAAGCLGRAWGASRDLLSVEDRCVLRREIYQRKKSSSFSN